MPFFKAAVYRKTCHLFVHLLFIVRKPRLTSLKLDQFRKIWSQTEQLISVPILKTTQVSGVILLIHCTFWSTILKYYLTKTKKNQTKSISGATSIGLYSLHPQFPSVYRPMHTIVSSVNHTPGRKQHHLSYNATTTGSVTCTVKKWKRQRNSLVICF